MMTVIIGDEKVLRILEAYPIDTIYVTNERDTIKINEISLPR